MENSNGVRPLLTQFITSVAFNCIYNDIETQREEELREICGRISFSWSEAQMYNLLLANQLKLKYRHQLDLITIFNHFKTIQQFKLAVKLNGNNGSYTNTDDHDDFSTFMDHAELRRKRIEYHLGKTVDQDLQDLLSKREEQILIDVPEPLCILDENNINFKNSYEAIKVTDSEVSSVLHDSFKCTICNKYHHNDYRGHRPCGCATSSDCLYELSEKSLSQAFEKYLNDPFKKDVVFKYCVPCQNCPDFSVPHMTKEQCLKTYCTVYERIGGKKLCTYWASGETCKHRVCKFHHGPDMDFVPDICDSSTSSTIESEDGSTTSDAPDPTPTLVNQPSQENNSECPICLNAFNRLDARTTLGCCQAVFHNTCIHQILNNSTSDNRFNCPACRNRYSNLLFVNTTHSNVRQIPIPTPENQEEDNDDDTAPGVITTFTRSPDPIYYTFPGDSTPEHNTFDNAPRDTRFKNVVLIVKKREVDLLVPRPKETICGRLNRTMLETLCYAPLTCFNYTAMRCLGYNVSNSDYRITGKSQYVPTITYNNTILRTDNPFEDIGFYPTQGQRDETVNLLYKGEQIKVNSEICQYFLEILYLNKTSVMLGKKTVLTFVDQLNREVLNKYKSICTLTTEGERIQLDSQTINRLIFNTSCYFYQEMKAQQEIMNMISVDHNNITSV